MRLLLIDNFDSFVYNLAQAFGALGAEPIVVRNDASLSDLEAIPADALVISPGPGRPDEAGISLQAIEALGTRLPLLGVCLGHQCIVEAFGGRVARATVGPVHGKTSSITHDGQRVFRGVASPFTATRYHSLAAEDSFIPDDLLVSAQSDDKTVMGVRHKHLRVEGVQFHPESVLTEPGPQILQNFLAMCA